MTNEEAIEVLSLLKIGTCRTEREAIEIAIKALHDEYGIAKLTRKCIEALIEKQIPKKPYLEGDGYADGAMVYDVWKCPNCDRAYEVEYDDYDYCPNCGQKIDWGNEDDGEN